MNNNYIRNLINLYILGNNFILDFLLLFNFSSNRSLSSKNSNRSLSNEDNNRLLFDKNLFNKVRLSLVKSGDNGAKLNELGTKIKNENKDLLNLESVISKFNIEVSLFKAKMLKKYSYQIKKFITKFISCCIIEAFIISLACCVMTTLFNCIITDGIPIITVTPSSLVVVLPLIISLFVALYAIMLYCSSSCKLRSRLRKKHSNLSIALIVVISLVFILCFVDYVIYIIFHSGLESVIFNVFDIILSYQDIKLIFIFIICIVALLISVLLSVLIGSEMFDVFLDIERADLEILLLISYIEAHPAARHLFSLKSEYEEELDCVNAECRKAVFDSSLDMNYMTIWRCFVALALYNFKFRFDNGDGVYNFGINYEKVSFLYIPSQICTAYYNQSNEKLSLDILLSWFIHFVLNSSYNVDENKYNICDKLFTKMLEYKMLLLSSSDVTDDVSSSFMFVFIKKFFSMYDVRLDGIDSKDCNSLVSDKKIDLMINEFCNQLATSLELEGPGTKLELLMLYCIGNVFVNVAETEIS